MRDNIKNLKETLYVLPFRVENEKLHANLNY